MKRSGGPAVRFFLSRALTPRVQANSRWTAVNAITRKAYAVGGKDSGSPFMTFLAEGRAHSAPSFASAIVNLDLDAPLDRPGYLPWYQALNFDYPFFDYADPNNIKADAQLMAAYAATASAPPIATPRTGDRKLLVGGRLEGSSTPVTACEEALSGWLRAAAGITHVSNLRHSQAAFRTSPSGGARQPTDIGLRLIGNWPEALQGAWTYDPIEHALVSATGDPQRRLVEAFDRGAPVAEFAISSHVRRAMWRYRDARAFRPVILDAAHVVETLMAALSHCGWASRWICAPSFVVAAGDLDPVFGYVIASPDEGSLDAVRPSSPGSRRGLPPVSFRTNPFISLLATPEGLFAENHQGGRQITLKLSAPMVETLAYATPSSRRDRPTSAEDLAKRGMGADETRDLVDSGLLLDEGEGDRLWTGAQVWSDHDWYLSLLAHGSECWAQAQSLRARRILPRLQASLAQRRTSRSFRSGPLAADVAGSLLNELTEQLQGIKVLLATPFQLSSLAPGTYVKRGRSFERLLEGGPSEAAITASAIGQPWARQFSCVVWLVPTPADEHPDWTAALVEIGRLAQRLALVLCAHPQVGVFQSPALVDRDLRDMFGIEAGIDGAYLVGVGNIDIPSADNRERLFDVNDLFAQPSAAEGLP